MLVIPVEGLDGVGKSTLIKKLKDNLISDGYKSSIVKNGDDESGICKKYFNEIMLSQLYNSNELTSSVQSLGVIFLASAIITSKYVKENHRDDDVVFIDRWLLSTMVYGSIPMGIQPGANIIYEEVLNALPVDFTILVEANEEFRNNNINKRNNKAVYESQELQKQYNTTFKLLEEKYKHNSDILLNKTIGGELVKYNTLEANIEKYTDVYTKIIGMINNKKRDLV